jgi:hypothetical protein
MCASTSFLCAEPIRSLGEAKCSQVEAALQVGVREQAVLQLAYVSLAEGIE